MKLKSAKGMKTADTDIAHRQLECRFHIVEKIRRLISGLGLCYWTYMTYILHSVAIECFHAVYIYAPASLSQPPEPQCACLWCVQKQSLKRLMWCQL